MFLRNFLFNYSFSFTPSSCIPSLTRILSFSFNSFFQFYPLFLYYFIFSVSFISSSIDSFRPSFFLFLSLAIFRYFTFYYFLAFLLFYLFLFLLPTVFFFFFWSRDSSVGIATSYGMGDWGVGVRVPVGSRIFSSPDRPGRLWGPPKLLSNGYRGLFSRGLSGRGVKLTTHLQLVPRSRKCESTHPLLGQLYLLPSLFYLGTCCMFSIFLTVYFIPFSFTAFPFLFAPLSLHHGGSRRHNISV
jgi:hypothetical protein